MWVYEHQREAVEWMLARESTEDSLSIRGGILADDMGLGKSVTLLGLYRQKPCSTLIVCPVSVIDQWVDECVRHLGIHPRVVDRQAEKTDAPIVIVSHTKLSRAPEIDVYHDRLVVDEAHRMKNQGSVLFKSVCTLQSLYRWCLTGTPIVTTHIPSRCVSSTQHRSRDIQALLRFLARDRSNPRIRGVQSLQGVMLRRQKHEVCDIPDMVSENTPIILTTEERQRYEELYRSGQRAIHVGEPIHVLSLITEMRLLCALAADKMDMLRDRISCCITGARVLIFCHFHAEMQRVSEVCREHMDVVMQYHGKVTQKERVDILEAFRSTTMQRTCLIMQIDSGGVGLNLQNASAVYIMSPSWSAASEQQAVSRAHRINTQHVVRVTRLLVEDSIEEFIRTRQQDKLTTSEVLLGDPITDKNTLWDMALQLFA